MTDDVNKLREISASLRAKADAIDKLATELGGYAMAGQWKPRLEEMVIGAKVSERCVTQLRGELAERARKSPE